MKNVADYRYRPLKPGFIRILNLCGPEADIDGRMQGILESVSLERPGRAFDAISYACGGQRNSEHILVDGKRVGITRNCHDGLQHLRDNFGMNTIWVDAICIAPRKAEKGQQIPLMTEIYGKARKVYIWLGNDPSKSRVSGDSISEDDVLERTLDWLQEISPAQYTLLSERPTNFPKNMQYREIIKAMRLLPQVIRASKLNKN